MIFCVSCFAQLWISRVVTCNRGCSAHCFMVGHIDLYFWRSSRDNHGLHCTMVFELKTKIKGCLLSCSENCLAIPWVHDTIGLINCVIGRRTNWFSQRAVQHTSFSRQLINCLDVYPPSQISISPYKSKRVIYTIRTVCIMHR